MVLVFSVASPCLFWSSSAGLDCPRLGAGGDFDPRGVLVQTSLWRDVSLYSFDSQVMVLPSMVKMTPSFRSRLLGMPCVPETVPNKDG